MSNEPINRTNVANANIGITNIIEKNEIWDTMMKTFIDLADKLKQHCGPYAGTAILADPDNQLAEPIFTKDGINIVRSINYVSPMQDFVRKQLAYMGSRVERAAGDGTTSSMIIMAYTLANLLEFFKKSDDVYSNADITRVWSDLVVDVEREFKPYVDYAVNLTDEKIIKFVAASQAYTSSHGDMDLAACIGELFGNTPRVVWDTLTVQKAIYETEQRYKVDIIDSEYAIDDVRLFPNDRCNEELGTVLKWDNVDCILQDNVAIGDQYQAQFHEYLLERIKSGERTIVICSDTMDSVTIQHYQQVFLDNPNHNLVFVMAHVDDAYLNDINALSVIVFQRADTGKEEGINTFKADVKFEGSTFRFLNGLIDIPKWASGLSPYYENEKYPSFNEFITHVRTIINREKMDVTRVNDRVVKAFTRILHKLMTTKYVTFTVGGAAYDNAAAQDVAMDALLATKCSLTKGFAAGRCVTLRSILKHIAKDFEPPESIAYSEKLVALRSAYIDSLIKGIDEVNKALFDSVGRSDTVEKAIEYDESPIDLTRLDDPSYVIPVTLQEAMHSRASYCILQPVETDTTFLKRFGEIGLKFLTANRVIMTGYLYSDNKKKR